MTDEEKYKEALLEARAVLEPCLKYSRGKVRAALDSIDHELQSFESEDERIRKIISDSVFYQYGAGVEYKDVLDYLDKLEKQKYNRMQPIYDNQESFESALDKAWKSYNESGARTVDSCEDDYTECAHAKGFREGFLFGLEKQKEHQNNSDAPKEKSVGGDFYSSDKDKNLDEIAQDYVDGVKKYNSEPTWDLMQTAVCYGANWQKEQFEKNRLANCDALSKEDCDRETDFAMEIIEKEHRQPTFNDAINYGMRLQKEQKPAEWSEEDEKMLRTIISDGSRGVELDSKQISWLKSLRPSWKPSKEQMCYLKKVYESYDFCDGERDALKSLYNDLLKKLGVKEEPEYYQHFDPDC